MLVLAASKGDKIMCVVNFGEEGEKLVEVTILHIKGGQIKLGFSAPGDVAIYRESIYQRVLAEANK